MPRKKLMRSDGIEQHYHVKAAVAPTVPTRPGVPLPAHLSAQDPFGGQTWMDDAWAQEEDLRGAAWAERAERTATLVAWLDDQRSLPGYDPSNVALTKQVNVVVRGWLDGARWRAEQDLAAGAPSGQVEEFLALEEHKARFLYQWRYGPALDCKRGGGPWQGERAAEELRDVLAVMSDPATGFPELSAARARYGLCPYGSWHRTYACFGENCRDGSGRRDYGPLPGEHAANGSTRGPWEGRIHVQPIPWPYYDERVTARYDGGLAGRQ